MTHRQDQIRALSPDEMNAASGGVGWFVALAVLAGSAALGAGLAVLTKEDEVLVPDIKLPPSEEPVRW